MQDCIIAPLFISKQDECYHVYTVHFSAILCSLDLWQIFVPLRILYYIRAKTMDNVVSAGFTELNSRAFKTFYYHIESKLTPASQPWLLKTLGWCVKCKNATICCKQAVFTSCSWAHVGLFFIQSCVSQSGGTSPRPQTLMMPLLYPVMVSSPVNQWTCLPVGWSKQVFYEHYTTSPVFCWSCPDLFETCCWHQIQH